MSFRESYLLWKITYELINRGAYRFIVEAANGQEVWLEKLKGPGPDLIHLNQYKVDWSNWVNQHNQHSIHQAKAFHKKIYRKNISVLNIYITPFSPVDDGLNFPPDWYHPNEDQGLSWYTLILDEQHQDENLKIIEDLTGCELTDLLIELPDEKDVLQYHELVNQASLYQRKTEQQVFQNGKPIFTYLFIAIQIIMFGWMETVGSSKDSITLLEFGAKFNPFILEGEWYRLVVPIFLHIGAVHLILNTIALYYLGTLVEKIYGSSRFSFIYMIAGIIGLMTSFAFNPHLSAGASGAIYGCFGALLYFGMFHPRIFFSTMGSNIFVVLAINIGISFAIPGIDISGHLGGLLGGFVASGIFHFPKKNKWAIQLLFLALTVGVGAGLYNVGVEKGNSAEEGAFLAFVAYSYIEEGKTEEAYNLLNIYNQDNGEPSAEIYFYQAYIEYEWGEIELAEKHLEKAIGVNPEFDGAYHNLSLIYWKQGLHEKALEMATRALELDPHNLTYQNWVNEIKEQ